MDYNGREGWISLDEYIKKGCPSHSDNKIIPVQYGSISLKNKKIKDYFNYFETNQSKYGQRIAGFKDNTPSKVYITTYIIKIQTYEDNECTKYVQTVDGDIYELDNIDCC